MSHPVALPVLKAARQTVIARMTRAHSAVVASAMAVFVFLVGGLLDWLVGHRVIPKFSMVLAGAVVALCAGLLIFKVVSDAHARQQAVVDRLQLIAEINHHIRNAVQVLAYRALNESEQSERAIQEVTDAVTRIDWVLREVLPSDRQHSSGPLAGLDRSRP